MAQSITMMCDNDTMHNGKGPYRNPVCGCGSILKHFQDVDHFFKLTAEIVLCALFGSPVAVEVMMDT